MENIEEYSQTDSPISISDVDSAIETVSKYRVNYSSSLVKISQVTVSPSDFETLQLIGKGDVGKVYLVRSKADPAQLFAMKGIII